jgi:putative peptidoglycan lipid II flippase
MSGGLYQSAHAARDGDDPRFGENAVDPEDGVVPPAVEPDPTPPQESADEPDSTASNSAIMAAGSLVSRATGFVRTLALSAALGGGAVANAYTTAQMLPGQIYELLLGGVLNSVLVPVLVRRRKKDPDGGVAYTQKLVTLVVACLGIAALLAVLAAPLFTAMYASDQTSASSRQLITVLSYVMLPMLFFTGLSALLGAVLNVRGHFAAPMWSPILNNLVVIGTAGLYIALFGARAELQPAQMTPARIALIGGGTLLGMVVQAIGLLPALRKVGFRWRFRWDPRSLGLREIAELGGWMLCYVAANQVGVVVVVKVLNAAAPDGRNAGLMIYNNVFLLTMMAHGIVGVSVMTALLPRMSAAAAEDRLPDVVGDLMRGLRTVITALAPVGVMFGVLALPVAVTLFHHGAYTADDTRATAVVLAMGAFAVLPMSVSYLSMFTFYSMRGNKTAALINVCVVSVRVGVQLLLWRVLGDALAAAGLILGNAVSYMAAAVIALLVLRRRIGLAGIGAVTVTFGKVLVAAGASAVVGVLVVRALPGDGLPTLGEAVLQLIVGGAVIMIVYLAVAHLLRVREVSQVVGVVRRKLGR